MESHVKMNLKVKVSTPISYFNYFIFLNFIAINKRDEKQKSKRSQSKRPQSPEKKRLKLSHGI